MAASANEPRWPPRSPHEALLSSPSGRSKLRRYTDRTSPSPSPLKKSATTPNLGRIRKGPGPVTGMDDEDEEDEETLQLRLDAIEARLKLKKLQQKKAKTASTSSDIENERPSDLKHRASSILKARQHYKLEEPRPKSSSGIQIPVSPSRKLKPVDEPKSPGRVLLGIDKGLKGRNISLKRPPVSRNQQPAEDDPFLGRRITTSESKCSVPSNGAESSHHGSPVKAKSFSERIAETRQLDKEQKERAHRIRNQRSTGFGIKDDDIATFKNEAENQENKIGQRISPRRDGFSREEVLKALQKPNGRLARNSTNSTTSNERRPQYEKPPSTVNPKQALDSSTTPKPTDLSPQPSRSSQSEKQPEDTSLYDPFSTLHLTKRILPHSMLTKTFGSKPILLLPSLLRQVHSPTYTLPPEYDTDFIVLAAIASKSSPLSHKDTHHSTTTETPTSTTEAIASEQNTRGKFMILTLTDLTWSLDLYLFTTAYTRFWKLTPGTLIAILNPSIMPPPPGKADTGRFSLVLNSSDDTVLELGTARDLSWCSATKRDGKQCGAWIDKRKTSVCDFHVDRVVERTRAGRMEVNGATSTSFGPKGRSAGRTGFWGGGGGGGGKRKNEDGLVKEGRQYDRALGASYYVAPRVPGFERGAASLLDAEGGLERGGSREERERRRRAEVEKERDIARRLGEGGNGIAAEYLRRKHGVGDTGDSGGKMGSGEGLTVDAKELGLMGNKARDVHLSPVKKRKAGEAGVTGGNGKQTKKTRFLTSKGVKEAGRESDIWLEAGRESSEDELEVV
ncbi:MAG: hypothetical protein Q9195_004883 [Heterodermia aff. obscurata]